MILKRKVNLTFFLLFLFPVSLIAEERIYPLGIDVIFPPFSCRDRIFIFSKNGRNQTLNIEKSAPNFSFISLNPVVQPVCYQNKIFVADKEGTFYFLSDKETKAAGKFSEKIIAAHILKEKLFLICEKSIKEFDGKERELPFKAEFSFASEKGIFIFGNKEFIFYDGESTFITFPFSGDKITGAAVLKNNFVVCDKNTVFFLNRKGRVFRKFLFKSEIVSAVSVGENSVAVNSTDHFIRLFDKKGNVLWQFRVKGTPLPISVTKKGILAASKNGRSIVLIEPKKGTEKWRYSIKEGEIHYLLVKDSKAVIFSLKENLEWVLHLVDIPQ